MVVLLLLSVSTYANDCYKFFVYNEKPYTFLTNYNHKIPGKFQKVEKQTTDGFFYYNGYIRVENGQEIGRILYKYYPETRTLFISHMSVSLKQQKVGTALLANVLKNHPETLFIRSNLGLSNFELFKKAKNFGKSDKKALRQTMAYKMRKRLGFAYIKKESIDIEMDRYSVVFEVSRFKD